jgi:hypothetical protein
MDDEGKNSNVEENITFGFPILDSEGTVQIKIFQLQFFLTFMEWLQRIMIRLFLILMHVIIVVIILLMHKTLNYFLLL